MTLVGVCGVLALQLAPATGAASQPASTARSDKRAMARSVFGKTEDGTNLGAVPGTTNGDGERVSHQSTPYDAVVALLNQRGFVCSGVVIAPRAVLTARHCLPVTRVLFGAAVLEPRVLIDVDDTRSPPNANVDVALVVLRAPAPVKPYPVRGAVDGVLAAETVHVVGFGTLDPYTDAGAGKRRYLNVPVDSWGCDGKRPETAGCRPDLEMLIPRNGGNDSCRGDSGGPVLEDAGGERRVVAITSRGISGALLPCGDGGIYVRLDRIAGWLAPQLKHVPQ